MGKKRISFLTGAGISLSSGISTFRGPNGIYENPDEKGLKPEEFLTKAYFAKDPEWVWKWHLDFLKKIESTKPSKVHESLVNFLVFCGEREISVNYVTQNIDSLETKYLSRLKKENSKSKKQNDPAIFEIHGNINYMRCSGDTCNDIWPVTSAHNSKTLVSFFLNNFRFFFIDK
jgi:NAD-dependent deacetylase